VLDFGDQTSDLICCLLPFTSLFVLSLNLCSAFLAGQIPKALLLLPVDLFFFLNVASPGLLQPIGQ
jgi:hypothetical protein